MGYGKESMSEAQKRNTNEIFRNVKRAADPAWKSGVTLPHEMGWTTGATVIQKRNVIMRKLSHYMNEDNLENYLTNEKVIEKTSWLNKVHIPAKEEIDTEIDAGFTSITSHELSQSQRTKRGKKFKEKAERQARAIRERNLYEQG